MKNRKKHTLTTAKTENVAKLIRGAKTSENTGLEIVEVEITLQDVSKAADRLRDAAHSVSTNPESLRDLIQAQAALDQYLVGMLKDFDIRIKSTRARRAANR